MKQKKEEKLRQAYSRGIDRLCPEPGLRSRILDDLYKRQEKGGKMKYMEMGPCPMRLRLYRLPYFDAFLTAASFAAKPGCKSARGIESGFSSGKEDNSSVKDVFIITIQEKNGRMWGSIEWGLPENSQEDAASGLQTGRSTSLLLENLKTKLLESAYSGILFIDVSALSTQESLQETSLFLTSLEDSHRFTILTTLQNQGEESQEKKKAWAQAALIPYVKGAETILLESNSPPITIHPLLQEIYPLSNSFGLPNEDGLLQAWMTWFQKEKRCFPPWREQPSMWGKGAPLSAKAIYI